MRIGIDLGGTKIAGVVLGEAGAILAHRRVPTPREDYLHILAAIADLVGALESDVGRSCSVGIGMPGTLSPHTGLVKNSNTVVLNGRPLDRDLVRELARPLRFENDANCFALSEAADGAGRHFNSVFGVIIGTGTGGGIVLNRTILRGANSIAGEWGHNPLPWPTSEEGRGALCYCGRYGCLETYLSGAGLARAYAELGGGTATAAEIARRLVRGETLADSAINRYADRLARGLAGVINVLDPDIIVLGGGLSNIGALYERVPALVARYVFSDHLLTRLAPALHGDDSGVRGAAWLWPEESGQTDARSGKRDRQID